MPDYFDCMRCGHVSLLTTKPPKCPQCGSGAGVIVTRASPPPSSGAGDNPVGTPKKDPEPGK